MALVLNDRVRETSTTTGTGAMALGGAVVGFQTFAAGIGNSNTCYYAISLRGGAEFETGLGTLDGSSANLTRTTVFQSSNSDSAVSFSAGTKDVFVTLPASKAVSLDADGDVTLGANLDVSGTLGVTGVLTANAGVVIDNTTIDGGTIAEGSHLTLDAGGDIILDSDSANWRFKDNGTSILEVSSVSSGPAFFSAVSDADMLFKGNDGGSAITALTLDMSAAGAATFSGDLTVLGGLIDFKSNSGSPSQIKFYCESSNAHAQTLTAQVHSVGATNTLTLPAGGNSTLVSESHTQTLTNKTLTTPVLTTPIANAGVQLKNGATSAGFLEFFEDSDNGTNKVTLIGPASTADVTIVLPAAADTLIGKATTDTLTNKSLDSDNNTITNLVNADIKASAAIAFSKMENLTASRALVSDGNGDVSVSAVTSTEVGYLDGVTSAIQTQINTKTTAGFAVAMAIAL